MKKIIIILLLTISPISAKSLYDCAMNYQKSEQFEEAIKSYTIILMHEPTNLNALFNLGYCYLAAGKTDEAINSFEKILAINPSAIPAQYNKAYTYKCMSQFDKAIELYKEIIAENSDYEPAHLALGFAYLMIGDFKSGWQQHNRYLKRSGKNGDELRALLATNSIAGKRIFLRPEGGLGDSFNFIRYAERLHDMGAYVIVAIQPALIPLLSSCSYIDELISCKATTPDYDADATLMSLPAIFNDTEETFPKNIPYIEVDQELINHWKNILASNTNIKVGICWQVDVQNDISRLPIARRECPLINFLSLQDIPSVTFYSLQKYDGVEELKNIPADFKINYFDDLDEKTGPFLDTAALMKNLDLIITVDTAIGHLAGALGCKVWTLLPYSTDWRWVKGRTYSLWYPATRVFKQEKPFDWQEVMTRVHDELKKLAL